MKSTSLCLALLLVPVLSQAAENNGFGNNEDGRSQSSALPDNINNLRGQPATANSSQPAVSRRQASNLATDSFEGRVLSIRLDNDTWRVRMDRDGTVFNVFVNANSGAVSRSR